jgi:FkbM family methyltransferase
MISIFTEGVIHAPQFPGKRRLLKAALLLLDGKFVRSRYGPKMRSNSRDFTNWACISGMYKVDYDDVFAEVNALAPGMAFIDVGANAGLFSLVAGQRVGSDGVVIAFEPSLPVYADMVCNMVANGLTNVFPFNVAIGIESGVQMFDTGGKTHTGVAHLSETGTQRVAVLAPADISQLLGSMIGDRDILIKIDVEGAEALVLDGLAGLLARPQVKRLVVEVDAENLAKFGATAAGIYTKLEALGFKGKRGKGAAKHYNEVFSR